MKRFLNLVLTIFLCFAIGCKDEVCKDHVDNDSNGICDKCGKEIETKETYTFNNEEYLKGLEERKALVLSAVEKHFGKTTCYAQKDGYTIANAAFYMYEETNDEYYLQKAKDQLAFAYANLAKSSDMFGIYYAIDNYCRYSKYFTDEELAYYKELLANADGYWYTTPTPNHSFMAAVARYLATYLFPEEDDKIAHFWGEYELDVTDYNGRKCIIDRLVRYPLTGDYEYNSDTYFYCHFTPVLTLAQFAPEEEIKNKAIVVLENMLASVAPIWLNGHMVVGSCRSYNPFSSQATLSTGSSILWYYFGGLDITEKELIDSEGLFLGTIVASRYIPSSVVIDMATDRQEAYSHKEFHLYNQRKWNIAIGVYLDSYLNKTYGVFSTKNVIYPIGKTIETLKGFYKQQMSWGVRWVADKPSDRSTFSIQHSYWGIGNNRKIDFGSTGFEETLQYEGTVIGILNIDQKDDTYQYGTVYISRPNDYKAIIDESIYGKMYIHYGNVIICFAISDGFINEDKDVLSIEGMEKGYFVVETFDPSNVDGDTYEEQLLYAQSMFESKIRKVEFNSNTLTLKYKNVNDVEMEFTFAGNDIFANGKINGEALNYAFEEGQIIQDNPWVSQKYPDEVIEYKYKNYKLIIDTDDNKVIVEKE